MERIFVVIKNTVKPLQSDYSVIHFPVLSDIDVHALLIFYVLYTV